MAPSDYMSDDYVAEVLKRDAKESSTTYSMLGAGSFMPKRPTLRAPKPNTKFLQNIIRDTNSHNAALKARETEDAASRLDKLHNRHDREPSLSAGLSSTYEDRGHRSKRRRVDEDARENSEVRSRHRSRSPDTQRQRHRDHDEELYHHRRHRSSRDRSYDEVDDRDRRRDKQRSRADRERSLSHDRHDRNDRYQRSRRLSRSRSHETHHRSRRHDRVKKGKRDRLPGFDLSKALDSAKRRRHRRSKSESSVDSHRGAERNSPRAKSAHPYKEPDVTGQQAGDYLSDKNKTGSDSDPLEAIIGPVPPPPPPKVRPRGRGAMRSSAGMDARFSSNYDPTMDVQPNSGSEDDWDQALEALQDRQRWKQQGADRLRAAGFSEKQVAAWEKGGEKDEDDVHWASKGEGREWDRGKVVTADGVSTAPEWGRLT